MTELVFSRVEKVVGKGKIARYKLDVSVFSFSPNGSLSPPTQGHQELYGKALRNRHSVLEFVSLEIGNVMCLPAF